MKVNFKEEFIKYEKKEANIKMHYLNQLILLLFFRIMPGVIIILTFGYLFASIGNLRKKRFFGDIKSYIEVNNLQKIFGFFYINGYVLGILICLLVWIATIIYLMFFDTYTDTNNSQFKKYANKIYILIGVILGLVISYLLIFSQKIQILGIERDNLNKSITNYINLDYIDYIDAINSCNQCSQVKDCYCSFVDKNDEKNLNAYLKTINSKFKDFSSFMASTDVQNAKSYIIEKTNNYTNVKMFDLTINAILTYFYIKNIVTNEYPYITLNKSFFHAKQSIFLSINLNKPDIYNLSFADCKKIFDNDINKNSVMVKSICNECVKINNMINSIIMKIKFKISAYPFPYEFTLVLIILIVLIIYQMSYLLEKSE